MLKNKKLFYEVLIIAIMILVIISWSVIQEPQRSETKEHPQSGLSQEQESALPQRFSIFDRQLLFADGYADASVIQTDDDTYLMYLVGPPKNSKSRGIFILSSTDGVSWQEETGTIFPGVAVARAFRFSDGIRYYYHQPPGEKEDRGTIVSSFSKDGITNWKYEGVRIKPQEGNAVAGPAVIRLQGGIYRMFFFEGELQEQGKRQIMNSKIYGASSADGLDWARDEEPTIMYEDAIEGAGMRFPQRRQVLHPFVIAWPEKNGYLMLYNSHSRIFAGFSEDGFQWKKLGYIGVVGADADAIHLPNGTFRIYFGGGCADVSRGFVHADDVKNRSECIDPETGNIISVPSTIHTAILKIE